MSHFFCTKYYVLNLYYICGRFLFVYTLKIIYGDAKKDPTVDDDITSTTPMGHNIKISLEIP